MSKELRFPRINTLIISGRLTRDPELRFTSTGKSFAKLSLAFDRSYKKNGEWVQEVSYIDVTTWERMAERCAEGLKKGSPILIEGSLRTYTYQDKNNQNRKGVEVMAHKINFLEKSEQSPFQEEPKEQPEKAFDDVPF